MNSYLRQYLRQRPGSGRFCGSLFAPDKDPTYGRIDGVEKEGKLHPLLADNG